MMLILPSFSCFNTLYLVSCKILLKKKREGENEFRIESNAEFSGIKMSNPNTMNES